MKVILNDMHPSDRLTPYFEVREMACKCGCNQCEVSMELMELLDMIRERFGPIIVNSGFRCVTHNTAVGGSANSMHMQGKAADIRTKNVTVTVDELADFAESLLPGTGAVIRYKNFVHVDVRKKKLRKDTRV